jgi:hypothetical protein
VRRQALTEERWMLPSMQTSLVADGVHRIEVQRMA